MPFLKIIDVSDVSLFFNVLGCLPHRWCHLVVQTLQGTNSQFLVLGTVSLETYPCLSHPKFQHPTSGLSDVSYIQASDKQWAMSGPTRRGSQILLIPRHRSKTVVKNSHFPAFQPLHRIDLSFSDAE